MPLNRSTAGQTGGAAPVRIVHLGLGAFHRAHQAWYTQRAETDPENPAWGIAAFTGRTPTAADELAPQDGLYTLVERSADGDSYELLTPIVEARPASDLHRLGELLVRADTSLVTLTITEAGYHLTADLDLDASHEDVAHDLARLPDAGEGHEAPELRTAAARLVYGLSRRIEALGESAGIAVVSCDNMADNATAARHAVLGTARAVDPDLAERLDATVSWVGTSVDRITPATTDELRDLVAGETGYADAAPVVAEPFRSWILSGEFPAGRPDWERAGAQFVERIEPFEHRKLWLLNGSHSLMAYAGRIAGHETVAQAIADPQILERVESLWDEAARHLTEPGLDVPAYRRALLERFRNPRIEHRLAQIGTDGAGKLRVRALPIYRAERAAGRDGSAAARVIAAWIAWLGTQDPESIRDSAAADIRAALAEREPVRALLNILHPDLGQDEHLVSIVAADRERA